MRQLAICNAFKYLPRVFKTVSDVYILKKLTASPISNAHWHSQCVTCAVNWRYFAIFLRRVERPQVINLIFSTHFLPPLSPPRRCQHQDPRDERFSHHPDCQLFRRQRHENHHLTFHADPSCAVFGVKIYSVDLSQ